MREDHRHCMVCGRATSPEKSFCSPSCEEVFRRHQKRLARVRSFMMLLFVLFLLLILFAGRIVK